MKTAAKIFLASVCALLIFEFIGSSRPAYAATCVANTANATICNPLPDATIGAFVVRMVTYALAIIAAVAVAMIVIAGFRMVVNSGSEDAMKKAQGQITNAVIGLAITVLAYAVVAIITNVLKGL